MSELCQTLNALAYETWVHMDYGFNRGYGRPDERLFTDHHMIELERRHRPTVLTAKIDQNRESQTGADFEWWLGDGTSYLAMRVQAKKLDLRSGRYEELARVDRRTRRRQSDVLIEASRAERFLPLYLFFNGPLAGANPPDACQNERLEEPLRGCTVALASRVKESLDRSQTDVATIAGHSWPWQCLCCCPLLKGSHPGQRALERLGASEGEAGASLRSDLPDYVSQIRSQDFTQVALDPKSEQLPGARTVMVMTLSGSPGEPLAL
jgi:hypothetical protein